MPHRSALSRLHKLIYKQRWINCARRTFSGEFVDVQQEQCARFKTERKSSRERLEANCAFARFRALRRGTSGDNILTNINTRLLRAAQDVHTYVECAVYLYGERNLGSRLQTIAARGITRGSNRLIRRNLNYSADISLRTQYDRIRSKCPWMCQHCWKRVSYGIFE